MFSRSSAGEFVALTRARVFLPFSEPHERQWSYSISGFDTRDRTFQGSSALCLDVLTVLGTTFLALHQAVRRWHWRKDWVGENKP